MSQEAFRIIVFLCAFASGSHIANPLCANGEAPNVLLILVDDLGYGDLSSYGATDLHTPHIDSLVTGGMKWTNFYANCPVCSPTRAALLTGRYPDLVGVPGVIRTFSNDSWGLLDPNVELLPAALKRAGYQTAIVGKWHLGLAEPNTPTLRGFDHFHGFLGDMMDDYYSHLRNNRNYMRLDRQEITPPATHATDLFADWACQWLQSVREDSPFFLYLAFNAPHDPVQPPASALARYRNRYPATDLIRARYAAFVEHLDLAIGKVTDTLHSTGRDENTLIIFTSDNGGRTQSGASNGSLTGAKQEMLEGGLRVPMCATWPGQIAANSSTDRVALTMDLFPSVCDAAGVEYPQDVDGQSVLPTLLGHPQPSPDRDLYWVRLEGGKRYQGKPYYCVRRGPWKLLQNVADEDFRLYNLQDDPREQHDVAGDYPETVVTLRESLTNHRQRCASVPFRDDRGSGPGEVAGH
ncbi:MAG: sulfatase-like hydrolase/transferase [Pirellulaceae bacterium]